MKTVLITGANKGIGLETARQLLEQGYFVYLGSRNKKNGLEVAEQLKAAGLSHVEAIELDVTAINSILKAKLLLEGKIPALDILINNAGIPGIQPQNLSTVDIADIRQIFETNYFGVIQTTQQFLPLLRKSEAPSIVNVSSEVGSLTMNTAPQRRANWDNYQVYGSSKTALNAFTIMLAHDLRDTSFRVNSVTPGYTATDLNGFQGTKTVAQGAKAIVELVTQPLPGTTGKFFMDGGEISW
ncbi:NAD(P)-dependent dehydrogenase (short-subunit alcohol dehydrogenase family) [Pedobacter cryoconitis]|uniref:NAD(P)-dependent dehydrogenase (Short-subunit alcohol dehydrogenase family) n=1 Tax=Pedobacter cryoconitis TaxID=188932 RepID=A0A7W8ZQE4_9SPHI|nr:SDR family NAD(P)-dependent oxidoreductase [Pedobacter cryoconitis]MBB5638284.1 NAD(P)-dependent dehydrogenase (short-subunit alcohol dehydrogenase family) [Pedobacter cryoconitis]